MQFATKYQRLFFTPPLSGVQVNNPDLWPAASYRFPALFEVFFFFLVEFLGHVGISKLSRFMSRSQWKLCHMGDVITVRTAELCLLHTCRMEAAATWPLLNRFTGRSKIKLACLCFSPAAGTETRSRQTEEKTEWNILNRLNQGLITKSSPCGSYLTSAECVCVCVPPAALFAGQSETVHVRHTQSASVSLRRCWRKIPQSRFILSDS